MLDAFARRGDVAVMDTTIRQHVDHVRTHSELLNLLDQLVLASDASESRDMRRAISAGAKMVLGMNTKIDDDVERPTWASKTTVVPVSRYQQVLEGLSRSGEGRLNDDLLIMLRSNARQPAQTVLASLIHFPSMSRWSNYPEVLRVVIGHLFNVLPMVRGYASHLLGTLPPTVGLWQTLLSLFGQPQRDLLQTIEQTAQLRCLRVEGREILAATDGRERPWEVYFTDSEEDIYSLEDEQMFWPPLEHQASVRVAFPLYVLAEGSTSACSCDRFAPSNLLCAARCQALGALYALAAKTDGGDIAQPYHALLTTLDVGSCHILRRLSRYFQTRLSGVKQSFVGSIESFFETTLSRGMPKKIIPRARQLFRCWREQRLEEVVDFCLSEHVTEKLAEQVIALKLNPVRASDWLMGKRGVGRPPAFCVEVDSHRRIERQKLVLQELLRRSKASSLIALITTVGYRRSLSTPLKTGRIRLSVSHLLQFHRKQVITRDDLHALLRMLLA